jgi:hypothetical protein
MSFFRLKLKTFEVKNKHYFIYNYNLYKDANKYRTKLGSFLREGV